MTVTKLKDAVDPVWQARVDLAASFRLFERMGMTEGIDSHLTARVPGANDRYFINPGALHWSEMRASDILMVDGEGALIEGDAKPPRSGLHLHLPIHRAHPRGVCVFHTHMTWAAALTCIAGGRLEMCHQNALRFYDEVAYHREYHGWAVDFATGAREAKYFGDKTILFLAHHGPVTAANSIAEAFDNLYWLERACEVQLTAQATGQPLAVVPETICRLTAEQARRYPSGAFKHFAAMKRVLDRTGSDYAT